ncbi:TonB-dependent receptor [Vibrio mangrovi]|uniref:Pesticin receptor n=1 Tax=Vibrio mangrovi TaxID=474394 RepID=A0A1Y6IYN8_9VIBR|nr:TonB-dependent receptor [Vibrio mangrovi]MDW6002266.1 TonB-dependent receptor [Vibrio mangrovi]SMS01612.1 Pesticin receptor precursor [Vibrio mangrovi]
MLPVSLRQSGISLRNPILTSLVIALITGSAEAASEETYQDEKELETVTVTARRTEEFAKDIPFSISVLDGDEITDKGMMDVEEVLSSTPGVMVYSDGGSNQSNIIIRGVGALSPVSLDDSSVVLNVDGVSMSSRNVSLATLDIEQIEVLKGPQGTLYGRNSAAGAVNISANKPTDSLESRVRFEAGEDDWYLGEMMVSGPLSDRVKARLAVRGNSEDHWVHLAKTGEPLTEMKEIAARASVIWDLNDTTELYFVAETNQIKNDVSLFVLRPYQSSPAVDVNSGSFADNNKQVDRYSVKLSSDLSFSRFESISAYTHTDVSGEKIIGRRISQALGQGAIENAFDEDVLDKVFSQELRLLSLPDSDIFWVTGLNYYHSDRSLNTFYDLYSTDQKRNYGSTGYAVYGEVTYPLTDRLSVTGGLRYSIDNKDYDASYTDSSGNITPDSRDVDDNYGTGRVAFSYALTPSANVYGMLARGYKSGGISDYPSQVADSEPYQASKVNTIEGGFKIAPSKSRYSVNGSMFLNVVKNDRLLGFDNNTFATTVINADTETRGFEIEAQYRLGYGLSLNGGMNYTDAEITTDALGVVGGDVKSGNKVPDVAKWNASIGLSTFNHLPEFWGLTDPMLTGTLSWRYVGDRPADAQNNFDLAAYHKIDMRVGVEFDDAVVYFWGKNLLDEQYELYGYNAGSGVTYGAPSKRRTLGIGFSYTY